MDEEWISCMDMEPHLLQSDIRSRSFLPAADPAAVAAGLWSVQHTGSSWASHKLVLESAAGSPFAGLRIADTEPLNKQPGREPCPLCSRSRKFFCYTCHVPVASLASCIPRVQLPIKVDIVKHAREVDGKSTAVHAPILAPDDVRILTYPDIPDYTQENTLLVFPGKDSLSLEEIVARVAAAHSHPNRNNDSSNSTDEKQEKQRDIAAEHCDIVFPYSRIVFIDSTWNQCRGIYIDQRIAGLPCVIISSRNTIFWRYQKGKPKDYLATIEAIYYFLVDYHQVVLGKEYSGEYDNMLFFFKFMYDKIHELYEHTRLRAYNWD